MTDDADDDYLPDPRGRTPVAELVTLADDDLGDALTWASHDSDLDDLVAEFARRLDDADTLVADGDWRAVAPVYRGVRHPLPLTGTGSDVYIVVYSLVELLKDRYTVWRVHDVDLSHSFLVLRHDEAAALRRDHPAWMKRHLGEVVPGIDGFSGVAVPWLGHEDAAPDFAARRAAADAAFAADRERGKRFVDAYAGDMRQVLDGTLPAGASFGAIKQRQEWLAWTFFAAAVVTLVATLAGRFADARPGAGWVIAALLVAGGVYHARIVLAMRGGWKPPVWRRFVPAVVLLLLAFSVPMR
jgi:hypothetical protein